MLKNLVASVVVSALSACPLMARTPTLRPQQPRHTPIVVLPVVSVLGGVLLPVPGDLVMGMGALTSDVTLPGGSVLDTPIWPYTSPLCPTK